MLVYFTCPTKRPGGHQIQIQPTMGQSLCLLSCNSSDTQRTDALAYQQPKLWLKNPVFDKI